MKFQKTKYTMSLFALNMAAIAVFATVVQAESNLYMGAPITLVEAPNGAIINKKVLDGSPKVGWLKPTIEQPVEGNRHKKAK